MALDVSRYRSLPFTNGGSKDLDVDGSVTPVEFTLAGLPAQDFRLERLSLYIEDGANFTDTDFGAIGALANGLQIMSGSQEVVNFQDNIDLMLFFTNFQQAEFLDTSNQQHVVLRIDLENPVKIPQADGLKIVVRDDLTGLTNLRAFAVLFLQ